MKIQYLGDSKDSFKWDYHDYLTNVIGYNFLNILLMMTPDDKTNDGKTKPDSFPARSEIIQFCKNLRSKRDLSVIKHLPSETGANYKVNLHNPEIYITKRNRELYFSELPKRSNQIIFLDPDNGFEPERKYNDKHVRYSEISTILDQIPSNSLVSVFQHFRRIKFVDDFSRIKERLSGVIASVYVTAIFWHQLMFVLISKSEAVIKRATEINKEYATLYPIEIP
ncbi:hypothetical protein [Candidatus Oleimmundimicrobium sp.]|uniref:hypothetical protein n=1 Tax=Candidatus Oleimmundimicrobium sp. TaxID=3060597 RepID=UPI00272720CF|nr:hypothetical protein [Candidatus Oleimmundimicrobium sp.]MDO8886592.1 hypothetical protein [Candidatus Oleimmundimicrobium sp.]